MKKNNFYSTSLKIICCAVFVMIGFCDAVLAQCNKDITIRSVSKNQSTPKTVSVLLTVPNGLNQEKRQIIENPKNWLIFNPDAIGSAASATDVTEQQRILRETVADVVAAVIQPSLEPESQITQIQAALTMRENLSDDINYLVKVKNLASPGCLTAPTVLSIVKPTAAPTAKKIVLAKSKDKKDSDIYIQGLLEGARKEKSIYSVDAVIKRRFRFAPNNFLEPFFELKTSTAKKADSDAAALGLNYVKTVPIFRESPLSSYDFTTGGKIEFDTNFKNVNLVYQVRTDFAFKALARDIAGQPLNIVPFIGFELGKNLKSPVAEAKSRLIARPFVGANLYFQIYKSEDDEKVFAFETQYIRRFLLRSEVIFKTDDDGNFVALPISGKPRDYVKSVFSYDFSKNFGLTASYEYGTLPPKFALVDSKFSFGLLFKGKFKEK